MVNPFRGEAALLHGEENLTLTVDINALCAAEEKTGLSLDMLLTRYAAEANATLTRALLWAALQKNYNFTIEQAGDIISDVTFPVARAALEKAMRAAMPDPGPAKPGLKKK